MCDRFLGYSLYELLMTLALVGVALTVGLPSFSGIVASNRLRAETDALFHAVHLARKDSIMQRRAVTLCASEDGENCTGGYDWSRGWIRFVNTDRDYPPVRDDGEAVLHFHQVAGQSRIVANRRGFTARATFLRATNGTLVICDRNDRAPARALVVSYTGRPRVAYADRRGDAYTCTD